jgi:hypothetical protein
MQSQTDSSTDQSTPESGDPSPVVAKWGMSNDGRLMIFITDGTDELSFHSDHARMIIKAFPAIQSLALRSKKGSA